MTGRLQSAFPDPVSSTGLMLWHVTNSWQRSIRAALAPYDLTHVQFVLLATLTAADRSTPITQRNLAELASIDEMMTSQVLRALERKQLVQRLPHPADGRARTLAVTEAGVALANRAILAVERADRDYFAPLADSLPAFTHSLATLATAKTHLSQPS